MSQQHFDNTENVRHLFEHADHHAAQPGNIHAPSSLLPTVLSRLGLNREDGEQNSPIFTGDPIAALGHDEWHVRAAAVRTLEKLGEDAPLEPLLMALEDEHPSVRAAAAHALGNMGTQAPTARLLHALHDPEWHVRETALLALTRLEQPVSGEALQAALQDSDAAVRETARQALEKQQVQPTQQTQQQHPAFTTHTLRNYWRRIARHKGAYMHKNDLSTHEFEQTIRSSGAERQSKKQSGWSRVSRSLAISAAIVFVLANIVAWSIIAQRGHPGSTQVGSNGSGRTPQPVLTQTSPASHMSIGKTVYVFHSQYGGFYSLAWSPDGKRIAAGTSVVQVWDATTGGHLLTYNPNTGGGSVLGVAWSPNGQRIASASHNVQVWNSNTGHLYVTYPQGSQASTPLPTVVQGNTSVSYLLACAQLDYAQSASTGTTIMIAQNPKALHSSFSGGNMIYALAWSPNGKYIASALNGAAYGYNVQIWDASTGKHILTYSPYANPNSTDYINAVAWSPDGKYIASGGGDNLVHVWNAVTGQLVTTYSEHSSPISSISWSPDGKYIASGSEDGTVQVWNALTGKKLLSYGQQGGVSTVAWSHDGTRIASAGTDVQIWNASTGRHIYTYTGHGSGTYIRTLAWSPDDKLIASGSNSEASGGDVRVWEAA